MITHPKDAEFLLTEKIFTIDIETETKEPNDTWNDKFGLSYVAPMTRLAFYVPGKDIVVFDNPYDEDIIEFVRQIFDRNGYTCIGHNVVFDLRSVLGHYGIHIPLGSYVWDTLTMAGMLLMAKEFREDIGLKALVNAYNLLIDDNERAFMQEMKTKRGKLHEVDEALISKYVGLDVETTHRLFELQRSIIASTDNVFDIPVFKANEDRTWSIEIEKCETERHLYMPTKNWSRLPELVLWELRISRWCANQAGRGIRLDIPAVHKHLEQLSMDFGLALNSVIDIVNNFHTPEFMSGISWMIFYEHILNKAKTGGRMPNTSKWVNWQGGVTKPDIFNYLNCADPDNREEWELFLDDYPNTPMPSTAVPTLNVSEWVHHELYESTHPFGGAKAKLILDWFRHYLTQTKVIDPTTMVNKKLFKPYYIFVVCDKEFPSSAQIERFSELVTPKLKAKVDKVREGEIVHWQQLAVEGGYWAISEDSLRYYFSEEENNPFVQVLQFESKINRVSEFLRHAERDGRIHSVIARKTRTGRATSVTMNLQNIDMLFYKGYLVADTDDRLLGGIDMSNAENWILAMMFGDNNLAFACASGDFHSEMTKIYWPERSAALLEAGDHAGFKALRRMSKTVTFGSAYGAGPAKVARMVGITKLEAEQLLANRDRRFTKYATGRDKLSDQVVRCYERGNDPPFVALWTGRRIPIPVRQVLKRRLIGGEVSINEVTELAAYKATNYLPQGGVGEIIWRAIVLASEWFEENNWDVKISLQVHDEIVFDAPHDIFFEAGQKIIEFIAGVIPENILTRTTPAVRLLADIGPENAKKWGYRSGQEYPVSLEKFANRWGIWDMPEGEEEAPTWVGPIHEGYTLDKEMGLDEPVQHEEVSVEPISHWHDLDDLVTDLGKVMTEVKQFQLPGRLSLNEQVYDFPNKMILLQELAHRGHENGEEYWEVWKLLDALRDFTVKYGTWFALNSPLGERREDN